MPAVPQQFIAQLRRAQEQKAVVEIRTHRMILRGTVAVDGRDETLAITTYTRKSYSEAWVEDDLFWVRLDSVQAFRLTRPEESPTTEELP